MNQDTTICLMTSRFKAPTPRAYPTPTTAPTTVCVEETGKPNAEARRTVVAAEKSIENPRVLFSSVILSQPFS